MNKRMIFAGLCTVLLASSLTGQNTKPLFDRVNDNVYRGKQPERADIPKLAAAGVRTVLDLRGKGWEKAAVEATGMRYVRIGLSGVFAPTDSQIDLILTVLEDSANAPVFVHCRRGADRSGMVIACYRITHDHWSNEQALKEAREKGFSRLEVLMQRYVRHFHAVAEASSGGHGGHCQSGAP